MRLRLTQRPRHQRLDDRTAIIVKEMYLEDRREVVVVEDEEEEEEEEKKRTEQRRAETEVMRC